MTDYTFPMMVGEEEVGSERELVGKVQAGPWMRGEEAVRFIAVHSTGTRPDEDCPVEQLLRDHKARGLRTIGYHFYIRKSGQVSRHRRLLEVGAHWLGCNRCSIAVCYEGGLDTDGHPADTRTLPQRIALRQILRHLQHLFPQAMVVENSQSWRARDSYSSGRAPGKTGEKR